MAKNLSAKLPKEDTLFINDVNQAAMEAFKKEIAADANVRLASSPREVAENAVSSKTLLASMYSVMRLLSYL